MLSIGRLKIKNFKSFKFIDIPLSSNFIALAGPNGSGKSNFTDAIRFALGEISLRSLRAKKVKDLIFVGSEAGEASLYFDGTANYEVHRAIRKDGKIRYRINGKKTTRQTILEVLSRYNLDQSGRNIIAQGEVQRIVRMNGKERRTILDSVAGISDFEDKKKEAMRELEIVNTRIKDASIVMGERLAYLKELGKEREDALRYQHAKGQGEKARASLLNAELQIHEENLAKVLEQYEKLSFNFKNRQDDLNGLEKQIADVDTQRNLISQELQAKQQTAGLIPKIEMLRASVSSKTQSMEDSKLLIEKLAQEFLALQKEIKQEHSDAEQLEKELHAIKQELKQAEEKTSSKQSASFSSLETLEAQIEKLQTELQSIREQAIANESEGSSKKEILKLKENELNEVENRLKETPDRNFEKEISKLQQDVLQLAKELDGSFDRMKELNKHLAEMDKTLLEQKERASILRMRVSPSMLNPALQYLNQKKKKGVHGTVAELIQFDPKYAGAVEAAAGARLLYVVVDDADIAMQLIKEIKANAEGRITFIPLKELNPMPARAVDGYQPLSNYLKCQPAAKAAVDFVFGSTLLAESMEDAKKIIKKARVVTLTGEIFEPSGIITGGKVKTSVLAASQLKELEASISELNDEKKNAMMELENIRNSESQLRSKKAESEVHIKTLQMQQQQMQNEIEALKKDHEKKSILSNEIKNIQSLIHDKTKEKETLDNEREKIEKRLDEQKAALDQARQAKEQLQDAEQKKREELASKLSFLKATSSGKQNELQLRKQGIHNKQEKTRESEKEKKNLEEKIISLSREITTDGAELKEAEEKIHHKSKLIEKLFDQIKHFELQLQQLGEQRGKKKLDVDRLSKDISELEVRKATLSTRLEDLTHEYEPYRQVEKLSLPKEKLAEILQQSETALKELGSVNMAAIEMYEKKKQELGEVEGKIDKLSKEREAILHMMDEIETHKREAFYETFKAVADNFQGMFKHLHIGQGILYLDKPNDPFESGLHIKLQRGNKEHTLDSLSGGENSLIALMFIFAMQFFKPSPFYILDEVDAALDKENSKNLAQLISSMSKDTQFLVVTHNDIIMSNADTVLGVTKVNGISKIVGVRLEQVAHA